MERPTILHLFTPARQASPFDINMAADAGWQMIPTHCQVELADIMALTQDAIFSRGPKGVARTGIFIGGRDVVLALDMMDAARKSMVPPFEVSLFADPSGACTTAAGMVASVERLMQVHHASGLKGKRVVVLGGTGPVGRLAAVMAAQAGADVRLSSHAGVARAKEIADATAQRFGLQLGAASSHSPAELSGSLEEAEVVLACAAAGVQVLDADTLARAPRLQVVGDVNAVPPLGIAGLGALDKDKRLGERGTVGIGALAIGNVKYQTQHQLLRQMLEAGRPQVLGPTEAFEVARRCVAPA